MSVTLKDIAEKAGVSISTVSRVINRDKEKPASQETNDKIWKIVRELGYIPNHNARNLQSGRDKKTKTIACLYTSKIDTHNDPFFSDIGLGIQKEANDKGYIISYALSISEMGMRPLHRYIMNHPIDGVIILGRFDEITFSFINRHFERLVYAGLNPVNENIDEVICNGYDATIVAINHLINKGYHKIGYIGDHLNNFINEHRFSAYKACLHQNGIKFNKNYIIDTPLSIFKSHENVDAYLKIHTNIPNAFFCANDVTAIGAMKALKEHNIKVPTDVALISIDNIEMANYVNPSLTTMDIPKIELGKAAVKLLIDQIETDRKKAYRIDLPFKLIERESV